MTAINRVVIVADDIRRAEAIREGLRHSPSCRVLGYADARRLAPASLRDAAPDVVVVDDGRAPGQHLAGRLRRILPDAKLVLLAAAMGPERRSRTESAGFDAIISKDCRPAAVGVLVGEIAAGNVFHSFKPAGSHSEAPRAGGQLTRRETELLRLAAAGVSDATIAAHLWVTTQTVKLELSTLYRKLGVAGPSEAGVYARAHGFVDDEPTSGDVAATRLAAVA